MKRQNIHSQTSQNVAIDEEISKMLSEFAQSRGFEIREGADLTEILDMIDTVGLPDETLGILGEVLEALRSVDRDMR